WLMKRVDLRVLVTLSFATFAAVSLWNARFTTDVTVDQLMLPRLVFGAAMPLFFVPLMTMAFSGLPPQRVAGASGLLNFLRMLGAGFGTSLGISLWDRREALHDARLSEAVNLDHGQFAVLHSLGANAAQSAAELAQAVQRQAFMQATDDFAWLTGGIYLALIAVIWLARRNAPAAGTVADAGH
ncbi:MAG TPA: MFS transporter, partial [Gammaproteobacteria bacterium]|nr:MFS transporter [Gammaproteobacteria bacterium]